MFVSAYVCVCVCTGVAVRARADILRLLASLLVLQLMRLEGVAEGRCHVKIVPGAKIVPAYVIVCLHPDNLPGNRRRDAENMFPNDEIT